MAYLFCNVTCVCLLHSITLLKCDLESAADLKEEKDLAAIIIHKSFCFSSATYVLLHSTVEPEVSIRKRYAQRIQHYQVKPALEIWH